MKKFEYKFELTHNANLEKELSGLGAQGWELVIAWDRQYYSQLILKREVDQVVKINLEK